MSVDFEKLAELKGYLRPIEGEKLLELASFVSLEHAIVEIGSYKGKSTCYLASGSKGAMVYAVDLWDLGNGRGIYRKPQTFKAFKDQVSSMGLTQKITVIKGHSLDVAKTWDRPIGLLFIDGNHQYESVKADFEVWHKFIVPGGYVAFHDYKNPDYPSVIGVGEFIDDVIKTLDSWSSVGLYHSLYIIERVINIAD